MSDNKKCIIFTGGENNFSQCVKSYKSEEYYIIWADKGYDYAIENGFYPDVLIGDLDSIKLIDEYPCEVIKYPKKKDDTDTMLAIKLAIKKNFTDIII